MKHYIYRTWKGISVKTSSMDNTLKYGVQSFGFLLPFNKVVSLSDFADIIAKHYSIENKRTLAIVNALRSA